MLTVAINLELKRRSLFTVPYPRENKPILNKRPSPLLLWSSSVLAQGYFHSIISPPRIRSWACAVVASIPGRSWERRPGIHCLRMRQLPQDSWGRDILVNQSVYCIFIAEYYKHRYWQHLWPRLVTSFVVMASTYLLLLLTRSLQCWKIKFCLLLHCGKVGAFFSHSWPALASLLAYKRLFDAISVRSVFLVWA